ncbi:MAG: hypothetical protein IPI46_00210 [Bacteroidetes bacterium]|nr:hypothetical protein [Bacteroidota bacterium]
MFIIAVLRNVLSIVLCIPLLIVSERAQSKTISIHFTHTIGQSPLVLNSLYLVSPNTSIEITTLKYYVSMVELHHQQKVVWKEKQSFHLINALDSHSMTFVLQHIPDDIEFDQLTLSLGVDSATNVSASMIGMLDPIYGMYWAWQSGYINFKLEGNSETCNSPNHEFAFHIGGFLHPFETIQMITLNVLNEQSIVINMDLLPLLKDIHFEKEHHIMQPCKKAVEFANHFPNLFSVK